MRYFLCRHSIQSQRRTCPRDRKRVPTDDTTLAANYLFTARCERSGPSVNREELVRVQPAAVVVTNRAIVPRTGGASPFHDGS